MDAKMQIRLPKEMYEKFKEVAAGNAQVPSLLVRNWIEDYINKNQREETEMKKVYKNVELDFTNHYPEADEPVIVIADVEVEIDEDGERTVLGAVAKESNEVFGVEVGDWFDPSDSIQLEDLE